MILDYKHDNTVKHLFTSFQMTTLNPFMLHSCYTVTIHQFDSHPLNVPVPPVSLSGSRESLALDSLVGQ